MLDYIEIEGFKTLKKVNLELKPLKISSSVGTGAGRATCRVIAVCEGATEQEFCKEVLSSYLFLQKSGISKNERVETLISVASTQASITQ